MAKHTAESTVLGNSAHILDDRNFIGIDLHSDNIVVCVLRNHINPTTGPHQTGVSRRTRPG